MKDIHPKRKEHKAVRNLYLYTFTNTETGEYCQHYAEVPAGDLDYAFAEVNGHALTVTEESFA